MAKQQDDNLVPNCQWCGNRGEHLRSICPARNVHCRSCGRKGHFAKCCRSVKEVLSSDIQPEAASHDDTFIGAINPISHNKHKWVANVELKGVPLRAKL